MTDDDKRAVRKCLQGNGFDATLVDELIVERKRLRDEFAMAAITGLVQSKQDIVALEDLPALAYSIADRAMEVRKK
jgi:hypothetical protein